MRLLVLGAGYVGMAVLSAWESRGDTFVATTTTPSKVEKIEALPNVEKGLLLEVRDSFRLKEVVQQCDGAIVCIAPGQGGDYAATYAGTARAVKEALSDRDRPFYLVYTSSTGVYGDQKGAQVDEETPLRANLERTRILVEAEDTFLSCANKNTKVCVLRLGGIYGPDRTLERRAQWLSGRELPGDGNEPTNHIHLDDIVRGLEFCVHQQLCGVFNLVNDEHRTRKELYGHLCHQLNIPPPRWRSDLEPGEGSNCLVSNRKIRRVGFQIRN